MYCSHKKGKMTAKSTMTRFTFKSLNEMFPDDGTCLDYIRSTKYMERIECPQCKKNILFHKAIDHKVHACNYLGCQFSPTSDNIFYKTPTPLTAWFYVVYFMAQTRSSISARQIQHETGVNYKIAWTMCKEIRSMLFEDSGEFTGNVKFNESYFGLNASVRTGPEP